MDSSGIDEMLAVKQPTKTHTSAYIKNIDIGIQELEYPITIEGLEKWEKACENQKKLWQSREVRAREMMNFIDYHPEAIFIDGFEDAILGITIEGRVIYNASTIIDHLAKDKGYEDALRVFDEHFVKVYVSDQDPIFQKTEF